MEAETRSGGDTWVGAGAPNRNHNGAAVLKLAQDSVFAFLRTKNPVPAGLIVVSAYYTVYARRTADWAGTKTLTARRTSSRVAFGRMTWNNRPGATGASATVTVTNAVDRQALRFDVTPHVAAWTAGAPNYGLRITSDSATAHTIYGYDSDYPPVLEVEYALSPSQPVDLVPAGGAVSVQYPTFSFDAIDLENPQDMTDLQIQINTTSSFTAPAFDTGWVPSTVPIWDSAGSAWAGIATGATVYWRARYRNGTVEGDWSDPVAFSRAAKSALTITNPAAAPNDYVEEATPPFMWDFAGTQVSYQVIVREADDPTVVVLNSGRLDGADTAWTPARARLADDGTYDVTVRVWDGVYRVYGGPGDPPYAVARRVFTVRDNAGVTAPVMVSAAQVGSTPFVELEWTRGTAPDRWTIYRDGEIIAADVEPADTLVSGTTHRWTDSTATPQRQHTYQVRAVETGNGSSPKSNGKAVTIWPQGVWLLDYDRDRYVRMTGNDIGDWARTDQVGVFTTVDGQVVQIFSGDNGISGSYVGTLRQGDGRTTAQWRADFDSMARPAYRNRTLQLVGANLSIPVKVRDLSATPHPETSKTTPMDRVRFRFFEVVD